MSIFCIFFPLRVLHKFLGCSRTFYAVVPQYVSAAIHCSTDTVKVKHQYYQYCTIPVPIIGGSSYIDLHLKNQLYIVYSSSEIQVERQHWQLPADRHGHKINKYDSRIVKVWECRLTRSYFENPKLSFCSVYRTLLFDKNLNSITKLTTDKKQNKRK